MLTLAKGEHATALHNYQEDATEDGIPTGRDDMDDGRRRSRDR